MVWDLVGCLVSRRPCARDPLTWYRSLISPSSVRIFIDIWTSRFSMPSYGVSGLGGGGGLGAFFSSAACLMDRMYVCSASVSPASAWS